MSDYPKRPSFFAHRFCRLLTKTCACQDVGHVSFVLCVTIAHLEDAKRYKGPVTFYNEQLSPLIGITKWDVLDRARKRAMEAGWLHYEPGNRGKRQPGRYWCTIPEGLDDLDDAPCDESQYPRKGEWNESQSPTQYPREGAQQGAREGELSTLTLNPNPKRESTSSPPSSLDDSLTAAADDLMKRWNSIEGIQHCRKMTTKRKTALAARCKESGWLDSLDEALAKIATSRFCRGQSDRGWKADIDWFLKPDTQTKILEGKYDGNGNGSNGNSKASQRGGQGGSMGSGRTNSTRVHERDFSDLDP